MSNLLADLHPIVQPICRAHLSDAWMDAVIALKRMTPELDDTARLDLAQLNNWMKGRNKAGEIIEPKEVVTNNRPGLSYHNIRYPSGKPCSLAYHIRLRDAQGRLVGFPGGAPMDDEAYLRVGLIGERLGLVWGGRWTQPHDPCHYEKHIEGATLVQIVAAMKGRGDLHGLTA